MKKGDKLFSVADPSSNPLTSPNTIMVAALVTLGIPLDEDVGVQVFKQGGKETILWTLKEKSLCGKYATQAMTEAWRDPAWHLANPEHPFAYIKTAFQNHTRLVEHIKTQERIVMKRRGKKIGLVTTSTAPAVKDKIISLLNAA